MPQRPPLSVTLITLNEERNIERAVRSVSWAEDVLVVDCGSHDRTVEIAKKQGARVLEHPWKGYGQQKNFAQDHALHDWVLSLDADEEVSMELRAEIESQLVQVVDSGIKGFWIPRKTWYLNRWILHGGWYPNALVRLADRRHARWSEPHVHEEWGVNGAVGYLKNPILHYSFPTIESQIQTNLRFARLGYLDLQTRGKRGNVLKLIFKPIGKFLETYILKAGCLDGLAGFVISVNAAHSMFLKYAYLLESRVKQNADSSH